MLRLSSLIKFANTQDITCTYLQYCISQRLTTVAGDYVPIGYWSTVEVHVSVICACLPALPSLFRKRLSSAATETTPLPHRSGSELRCRDSKGSPSLKVASAHQRDNELSPSRQIKVSSCVTVTNSLRGNEELTFNGMPSTYSSVEAGGKSAKR
jgi:hypothetical protein